VLTVKNIETFYGRIQALRGVSLEVNEAEIRVLLGANGAGKTTTLKTIMGLLEDQPDKGTITFLGKRIDQNDPEEIVRMGIGYVPEGREIFPELTVLENLKVGAYIRRNSEEIRSDLERIYNYFPILQARKSQLAGTLSGGEQQMLAIGRALMARPRLLLLDEPSLGLSPPLVKEIFQIIQTIHREGTAILLVEQNARIALSVASYGYILETGRIVLADKASALLDNEDVKEFYLGVRSELSIKGYQRYKRKKRWN
jgi:branched-chain amino acid transport system ATP-binding protein